MIVNPNKFYSTPKSVEMNNKPRHAKRAGGTLQNWSLIQREYEGEPYFVIIGDDDDDSVWRNTYGLRTSVIVSLDTEANEAETLNTIYKLGLWSDFSEEF